jgi:hypothetical protein
MGNHALIYGASGISGWAIVNAILNGYPSKDAFSKVTAMVNRPLTREMALWPDDPRLQIVSGVDLVKGTQEELEKQIKEKVTDVESVTQVYFYCERMLATVRERKLTMTSIQAVRRRRVRMQGK